jgi:hypothetical protein
MRDPGRGITFLLVSGYRVNRYWHATITKSLPLQQAMFLKPKSVPAGLLLNPLIGRIARTVTSVQEDEKASQTWHKMLVVQTSESQIVLQSKHFSGGGYYSTIDVSFAGDVLMVVFATWISKSPFPISFRKWDRYETPVIVLERDNCTKRGIGEISYKATSGVGGR